MRKSTKLLGALAVAGVLAVSGSAFTAASTIDDAAINVGSVAQSVSGATVTNVAHTYTAETDTTTALTAKAEELLSTAVGVVTVSVNLGAAQDCTVTWTDVTTVGVDDGPMDFSTIACDITDTVNVTSVRFIVNG